MPDQRSVALRVVITASRLWPTDQIGRIHNALALCAKNADDMDGTVEFRIGDARGGDTYAYMWAIQANRKGMAVAHPRRFVAAWSDDCRPDRCPPDHRTPARNGRGTICPFQGFFRNELMCDTQPKPDLLLAFVHKGSGGATQCIRAAKARHIDLLRFNSVGLPEVG